MLEPVNREYLCRLAKQWSDLTYEDGATVEQIQEVNSKAMEYAERVIAMAPKVRGEVLLGGGAVSGGARLWEGGGMLGGVWCLLGDEGVAQCW
jgi:hypothetical protein